MSNTEVLYSAFNVGEIDPLLKSRVDLDQYYLGADRMRNVLLLPQGGVRRRPGLRRIDEINERAELNIPEKAKVRLHRFVFSETQEYLLVFTNLRMDVYRNEIWQTFISTPYTDDYLPEITFAQSLDTLLVFHRLVPLKRIQRLGTHTSWALDDWPFTSLPTTALPAGVAASIHEGGIIGQNHITRIKWLFYPEYKPFFQIKVNGQIADEIAYNEASFGISEAGMQDLGTQLVSAIESLPFINSDNVKVTVTTVFIGVASSVNIDIEFEGKNAFNEFVVEKHEANSDAPEGFVKAFEVSTKQQGRLNRDTAFNETNGYPRAGTFYQDRLWLMGSDAAPQSIWASRIGDPTDFFMGDSVADQEDAPIAIAAQTNQANVFRRIHPGRHLQIFADSGEFYIPVEPDEPITNQNISLRQNSYRGCSAVTDIIGIDGSVYFIDQDGEALREMVFKDTEQAYTIDPVSTLSSHLIVDPVSLAYRKSVSTNDPDYLLIVNTDGTLTVFTTIKSQNMHGFTQCSTAGSFISSAVVDDTMYFAIRRQKADNTWQIQLEKFDDSLKVDNAHGATAIPQKISSVSGLDWLEGADVSIVLDNTVQPVQEVSGGVVTFAREAKTEWQVGLPFPVVNGDDLHVWVRLMPLEVGGLDNPTIGREKRIREVTVRLNNSSHLVIQGYTIPFRNLGSDLLDDPIPIFTGDKKIEGILGWAEIQQLEFGQKEPLGLTLLGAAVKAQVT